MRLIAAAVTLALSLSASAAPQEKVTLEWKLKKGDTLRYEMSQENHMELGGMEIEQESLFGLAYEVTEVSDKGVATFKVKYDRVKFIMKGMMDTAYDSETDKEAPEDGIGKMMAGMLGKSFTLKLNGRGEITAVAGYEALIEEVTKDLGDDPMMGQMKGQFTDDMMKKMMQQMFPVLNEKAVAKGDAWEGKSEFAMPGLGTAAIKTKTSVKEIKEKETLLDQEGKIEQGEDEGGQQMVQITEGKSTNVITWDTEKGVMKSLVGTTKMTMAANGQEFTMEIKSAMKLAPKKDRKDVPTVEKPKEEKKDK